MIKIKCTIIFFVFPMLIFSQVKTPFVTYDYEADSNYIKALESYKKLEEEGNLLVVASIAELSFKYKDWFTAIEYFEKLLIDNPIAKNYFKLSVASARKSLEVSRFFSVPFLMKARKSVLKAHEMEPKMAVVLNLLIKLYAEIPSLLGGSIAFAEQKADELNDIDTISGKMMQAYLFGVKNNFEASKSKYAEIFHDLKQQFAGEEQWFKELRLDMVFELGRAASEYNIESEAGKAALDHYIESYEFKNNYPLEWAYYYQSKIYYFNQQYQKTQASLQKALEINPNFEEARELFNIVKLE